MSHADDTELYSPVWLLNSSIHSTIHSLSIFGLGPITWGVVTECAASSESFNLTSPPELLPNFMDQKVHKFLFQMRRRFSWVSSTDWWYNLLWRTKSLVCMYLHDYVWQPWYLYLMCHKTLWFTCLFGLNWTLFDLDAYEWFSEWRCGLLTRSKICDGNHWAHVVLVWLPSYFKSCKMIIAEEKSPIYQFN